jgi:hypothetical protein
MIAIMLPSIFTIEVGDTPTLVFEAQNLREAHELCHEQWLKGDLTEAKSGVFRCGMGRPSCEREWQCPTKSPCLLRPKITVSPLTA